MTMIDGSGESAEEKGHQKEFGQRRQVTEPTCPGRSRAVMYTQIGHRERSRPMYCSFISSLSATRAAQIITAVRLIFETCEF